MEVVINEFEVLPENAPPPEGSATRAAQGDAAKSKEKPDFEKVARLWTERRERVRAH
jgi:hypothetical protein